MDPTIEDVAAHLGKQVCTESAEKFAAIKRLVAISRRYGGDAGLATLAGCWLGEGMSENEVVARCWPRHKRFETVDNPEPAEDELSGYPTLPPKDC